jgi:hypothetical protein
MSSNQLLVVLQAFRACNIQLADYVPRADATIAELSEEDDKAARFATLAQRHAGTPD